MGSLFLALLVISAVEIPTTAAEPEPSGQKLIEANGGVAVHLGSSSGLSSRIGVGLELPLFNSQTLFAGLALRVGWQQQTDFHFYAFDTIDALAGLRFGARFGKVIDFFFGLGLGLADTWSTVKATFQGWRASNRLGVAFQVGAGVRFHLGQRITLFIVPAELTGDFWPTGGLGGTVVTADFTPSVGLGVRW